MNQSVLTSICANLNPIAKKNSLLCLGLGLMLSSLFAVLRSSASANINHGKKLSGSSSLLFKNFMILSRVISGLMSSAHRLLFSRRESSFLISVNMSGEGLAESLSICPGCSFVSIPGGWVYRVCSFY